MRDPHPVDLGHADPRCSEQQFQTNVVSHFALIEPLLPLLQQTAKETGHDSRVVMLSSFAHNFSSLIPGAAPDFTSLERVNRPFSHNGNWARYAQSKVADHLLARKFDTFDGITAVGVHPGFVVRARGYLAHTLNVSQASELYKATAMRVFLPMFISLQEGAISSLYAATSPEVEEKKLGGSCASAVSPVRCR